ncbi:MAG: hypothetical protein KDD66_04755 [Bdellovibrionales bacterium]|nr:hypothetical protein [Bdellovibrionales bacterium]
MVSKSILNVLRTAAPALALCLLVQNQTAAADDYASAERVSAARGHYARARTLLVEALAEFERGRRIARPDILLDPEEWRLSVVSRTEELNRVLDPQPRVTRSGTRFKANSLLIQTGGQPRVPIESSVRGSSTFGEEQRAEELKRARELEAARQTVKEKPVEKEIPVDSTRNLVRSIIADTPPAPQVDDAVEAPAIAEPSEPIAPEEPVAAAAEAATPQVPARAAMSASSKTAEPEMAFDEEFENEEFLEEDNEEISKAIEDAIKARLKRIDGAETKPQ